MIDIADLEAKARAATQGEWYIPRDDRGDPLHLWVYVPGGWPIGADTNAANDAAYIVAAQPSVVLELIERIRAAEAKAGEPVAATHRHKKSGTEYVLIGIGKMQSKDWISFLAYFGGPKYGEAKVDMREVAIYRSTDDGSLWVRPREEFEDGRFEVIARAASPPSHAAPVDTVALTDRVKTLEEALRSTLAALVATTSLLVRADQERVRPSRAVASDAMFRQMLKDYDKAAIVARTALGGSNE